MRPAQYDLRHLRHFVSAHEHGTLQAAATHLHVSQSALTKSIQRLEETLGAPLFDRSGRRLVLNPLGERMLRRAEALLRSADDLQREADLHMHAEIGEVVLGVGPVVALGRLPDVLTRYCAAHPTVRVVVRAGSTQSLVPRLMEGELHFVVADHELPSGNPALHARSLGPDPIGVAVRPGHPLRRRRKPLTLLELRNYPRAAAPAPPRIRAWAQQDAVEAGVAVDLTCDNYEVLVTVAERTDTLVFGTRSVLERYERTGRVRMLPFTYPSPASEPAVLSVRDRPLAPAVYALMDEFEYEDAPT
mgnify:CR=1 FL=1